MRPGGGRATWAIVRWQLGCQLGPWIAGLAGAVFGAVVLPGLGVASGPLQEAALSAMVLVAVGGCVALGFRRSQTVELTSLRYFAAPLYGRELARAHALVPCLRALAFPLGLAAGLSVAALLQRPVQSDWASLLAALALGQPVAAAIALSGCLRQGRPRALYAVLAVVAGTSIEWIGIFGGPLGLPGAALAAAAIGFAGLRAFGETLARYDPVWT
jgi:hypothetical protein